MLGSRAMKRAELEARAHVSLKHNKVTVSCSQHGVQCGQDSETERPDEGSFFAHGRPEGWRKLLGLSEGARALCASSAPEDTAQHQAAEEAVGVLAHTDATIGRHGKLKL